MKLWKRWTTGIASRVDAVVAQVENHEALVNSALRDLQRATARAQVELRRVKKDGQNLETRLAETRAAVDTWRERAHRSTESEETALECLRRSRRAAQTTADLERRLEDHQRIERQLVEDVRALEERLSALKEQRNLMRTRQTRAEALDVVAGSRIELGSDIEEIFDRWETRVATAEAAGSCSVDTEDSLEAGFAAEEEEALLRAELRALRGENDDHGA